MKVSVYRISMMFVNSLLCYFVGMWFVFRIYSSVIVMKGMNSDFRML